MVRGIIVNNYLLRSFWIVFILNFVLNIFLYEILVFLRDRFFGCRVNLRLIYGNGIFLKFVKSSNFFRMKVILNLCVMLLFKEYEFVFFK